MQPSRIGFYFFHRTVENIGIDFVLTKWNLQWNFSIVYVKIWKLIYVYLIYNVVDFSYDYLYDLKNNNQIFREIRQL